MRPNFKIWIGILFSLQLSTQKLMVLGRAQDAGKPQLGCEKECCQPGATKGNVVSLAWLEPDSAQWTLIEASPDISEQFQLIPQGYARLPKAVYVSHAHIGHYTGLMYFGREACNTHQLPLYCGEQMAEFLSQNGPWSQLFELQNLKLHPQKASLRAADLIAQVDSPGIYVFKVPHRDEFSETLAYIIKGKSKTALFIPDIDKWQLWDEDIVELVQTVDYALLDATFYNAEELPGRDMSEIPHPFVIESMALFDRLDAEERAKIHFIHLNHSNPLWNPQSDAFKEVEARGYHLAWKGQIFNL